MTFREKLLHPDSVKGFLFAFILKTIAVIGFIVSMRIGDWSSPGVLLVSTIVYMLNIVDVWIFTPTIGGMLGVPMLFLLYKRPFTKSRIGPLLFFIGWYIVFNGISVIWAFSILSEGL